MKNITFSFGRLNPPTTGHGKLLDALKKNSGSGGYRLYLSKSHDKKKNPLSFKDKVKYSRLMFPKHSLYIMDESVTNVFDILVKFYDEGYEEVKMVVGSDRISDFKKLILKYNGVDGKRHGFYDFKKVDVVSAGDRDPDAEGVEGMSASKMRAAVSSNDFELFKKGLPPRFKKGQELFDILKGEMNIKSFNEWIKLIESRSKMTDIESDILSDIKSKLPSYQITNSYKNGGFHIRLKLNPSEGLEEKLSPLGYKVSLAGDRESRSSKYNTYKATSEIGSVYIVLRNVIDNIVGGKDLTPDHLGVTGQELTAKALITIVKKKINKLKLEMGLNTSQTSYLIELLTLSQTKGNDIPVPSKSPFNPKELKTISANFGESCAAIWAMSNIGFSKVLFPSAINEPLLDFYGIRGSIRYPISVKSGQGSSASITNLDGIMDKIIAAKGLNPTEEKLITILKMIIMAPVLESSIQAHGHLNTAPIKELYRVTGTKVVDSTVLRAWLKQKNSKELKVLLSKFFKMTKYKISDATWKKYDDDRLTQPEGIIIAPLTKALLQVLNSKEYTEILSSMLARISILQLNADALPGKLRFKYAKFKNMKFEFSWGHGATAPSRSRIGFKAIINK